MTGEVAPGLVEIRLVGMPLPLYRQASEHQDELEREFALVRAMEPEEHASVPARVLTLIDELDARFAGFTRAPQSAIQQALARDDQEVDLVYHVPAMVRQASIELGELLDEADEYCSRGEHLLTLTTPPGPLALRRWFLGEFVAQIDGAAPTPWADSPHAAAATSG